jgi:hypothetical protein
MNLLGRRIFFGLAALSFWVSTFAFAQEQSSDRDRPETPSEEVAEKTPSLLDRESLQDELKLQNAAPPRVQRAPAVVGPAKVEGEEPSASEQNGVPASDESVTQ